jgi:hypothetical protein
MKRTGTAPLTNPIPALQDSVQGIKRARQVDAAWAQNAADTAATDATWNKAEAQAGRQSAKAAPDFLGDAFWLGHEPPPANIKAATASQVRGFSADQADQVRARAQQQATQEKGTNLQESSGAWLERQLMQKFKQTNPGVPVTGAGVLSARTPEDLFTATQGAYGSPAWATSPGVAGITAQDAAPVVQAARNRVAARVPATPQPGAPELRPMGALATNGKALTQAIFRDHFPGHAIPTTDEIDSAINDAAVDGLDPDQANAALNSPTANYSRDFAHHLAARVAGYRGLASAPDAEATQAIQNAFAQGNQTLAGAGNGFANGPSNMGRGINNLPRWTQATHTYRNHGNQMIQAAQSPSEALALSRVMAEPTAARKQAIAAEFAQANPEADMSRFTPELMRGR